MLYGNHFTLETLHFRCFVRWRKKQTSTSTSLVEVNNQESHMLQKHPILSQGRSKNLLINANLERYDTRKTKWDLPFYSWILGFYLGGGVLFCIFAKIHLFLARRSAANIDFNRCNDTSVPKSQQRYNPNVLKGIIIETSLASIIIRFCFILFYTRRERVDDQSFRAIEIVEQITGLLSFVLLPFLYILFTPSVRKHVPTILSLRSTSVTPEVG